VKQGLVHYVYSGYIQKVPAGWVFAGAGSSYSCTTFFFVLLSTLQYRSSAKRWTLTARHAYVVFGRDKYFIHPKLSVVLALFKSNIFNLIKFIEKYANLYNIKLYFDSVFLKII